MLPAAARLRHRDEFAGVLRRGRRVTRGPLVVHAGPPTDRSGASARVGFVISGKVGNAVHRNRLRRRLRHLLRARVAELPAADLVVRALPGACELSYAELERVLDDGLHGVARR